MVRGLKEAGVAQPDDALLVMSDFGAVMIVGFELVRLNVPVNARVPVIGVALMQVLLRQSRGADQPRHKSESDDRAAQPG